MLIIKKSNNITVQVFEYTGAEENPNKKYFLTINVPQQEIFYNLEEDIVEDLPLEMEIEYWQEGAREPVKARGTWPLELFVDFVEGARQLVKSSLPFISVEPEKGSKDSTASGEYVGEYEFIRVETDKESESYYSELRIGETIYIRSKFFKEKVGGRLFSSDYKGIQNVSLEIFGVRTRYVRWSSDLLKAFIEIRHEVIKQRESLLRDMRKAKQQSGRK